MHRFVLAPGIIEFRVLIFSLNTIWKNIIFVSSMSFLCSKSFETRKILQQSFNDRKCNDDEAAALRYILFQHGVGPHQYPKATFSIRDEPK